MMIILAPIFVELVYQANPIFRLFFFLFATGRFSNVHGMRFGVISYVEIDFGSSVIVSNFKIINIISTNREKFGKPDITRFSDNI